MSLLIQDRKYLMRDSAAYPINVVSSDSSYFITADGKKYIDFVMGWCVGNLGWGNKEIQKRIQSFKGPFYVTPTLLYAPWVELAKMLAKITPGKLTKCFRATGGTEAVDIAIRTASRYTKRHKFISIEGSYHGDSIGTLSIGASDFRKAHPGLLFSTHKISPPFDKKAADNLEKILKTKEIAALVMEPIICNLAVIIPEKIFMTRVQALCKKYGTLLIIDEVATGFGRTGKMFGIEHFNIEPDIMCFAKALTGGYGAMGAVITTEKIAKSMEFESSYYSTFGWHPLSVEAAIANIQYHLKHQKTLRENTARMSQYFHTRLQAMPFKSPPEIRIIGLAIGVAFKEGKHATQIVERARKKGLIISGHNDREFTLFPALNITQKIAKAGLDILEQCV